MTEAMLRLFDRITDPALLVRRVNIAANHVLPERFAAQAAEPVQLELFSTPEEQQRRSEREEAELLREKRRQQTVVALLAALREKRDPERQQLSRRCDHARAKRADRRAQGMNRKYRALLEHGRTDSRRHPPMPNRERAAQFAPFSALNGYEDAVAETARLTEAQTELSESAAEELDEKLRSCRSCFQREPEITVCYFEPDARKAGGAYRRKNGRLRTARHGRARPAL